MIARYFITPLLVLSAFACESYDSQDKISSGVSLHTGLGGDAAGYQRACGPMEFQFPKDHGAHPEFRNEWWYITGNLENTSAQRFGVHITFFRIASAPQTTTKDKDIKSSAWSGSEFYMAHFAITSAADKSIKYFERFGRSAAGLAGVSPANNTTPNTRVWLDDWQLDIKEIDGQTQLQLALSQETTALSLTLEADTPIIKQGVDGYSQKSADPCNASYYYSLPRLTTTGDIIFNGIAHSVTGSAWLDREWSSSALADNQVGWDWFAMQLDDGRSIMVYQLRLQDNKVDTYSHAVEIDAAGNKTEIPFGDWTIETDEWWQSDSGSRYPVSGTFHRRDTKETIAFKPLINDQELDLTVRYWEGAIDLTNTRGQNIGRGYMELTGY